MADQEFKMLITGDASSAVAATQQAGDATKKLADQTGDLSHESKGAAGALGPLEENLKKSGKAAEESGLSHRELGKVLLDIGNVAAPGAGAGLRELAFGPVGAALALVSAYEKVKESLDAISEAADQLNEKELENHRKAVEDLKTAWDNAREQMLKYDEAVENAGKDKDPAATRLQEIKDISAAQTQANLKHLEELGKLEVAYIRVNGAKAGKSAAEIDKEVAASEQKTRRQEDAARAAAENKSVADIQADIEQRKANQPGLNQQEHDAENHFANADVAEKNAQRHVAEANDPAKNAAVDKDITGYQDEIDRMRNQNKDRTPGSPHFSDEQINGVQEKLNASLAERDTLQKAKIAAEEEAKHATDEKIAAQNAVDQARAAGVENQTKIRTESEQAKTQAQINDINRESRNDTATQEKKISDLEIAQKRIAGKDPNEIIAAGARGQDDINAMARDGYSRDRIIKEEQKAEVDKMTPGAFTSVDKDAMQRYQRYAQDESVAKDLAALLETLGTRQEQMAGIIRYHLARGTSTENEINALQNAFKVLQGQMRNTGFNGR